METKESGDLKMTPQPQSQKGSRVWIMPKGLDPWLPLLAYPTMDRDTMELKRNFYLLGLKHHLQEKANKAFPDPKERLGLLELAAGYTDPPEEEVKPERVVWALMASYQVDSLLMNLLKDPVELRVLKHQEVKEAQEADLVRILQVLLQGADQAGQGGVL